MAANKKTHAGVDVSPAAPKSAATKDVRHVVLREYRGLNGQGEEAWHPLLSVEHGADGADDLIAAAKIRRINAAVASGAEPPRFRIAQEINGQEVAPL